jgi:hypothetical protein
MTLDGDDDDDDGDIDEIVLKAVAAIDLDKTKQDLNMGSLDFAPIMNGPSAMCIVDLFEGHPDAVAKLHITFDELLQRVINIFRE